MMEMLTVLIIGAVAGYFIGLMKKIEPVPSLVLGVIGGFLGHFLFGMFKITFGGGMLGTLLPSFLGALIVVFLYGFVKKQT